MASVFISHSSIDKPYARRLAVVLAREGIPVWLDERYLDVGDNLPDTLRSAVANASLLVVLLSQHSVSSPWVAKEIQWALEHARNILIPLRLDDTDPPKSIADRLYIDVFPDSHRAEVRLLRLCQEHGLHEAVIDGTLMSVPIEFYDYRTCDATSTLRAVSLLSNRLPPGFTFSPAHLLVNETEDVLSIRKQVSLRASQLTTDTYYGSEWAEKYSQNLREAEERDRRDLVAMAELLTAMLRGHLADTVGTMSSWSAATVFRDFVKQRRHSTIAGLYTLQKPDDAQAVHLPLIVRDPQSSAERFGWAAAVQVRASRNLFQCPYEAVWVAQDAWNPTLDSRRPRFPSTRDEDHRLRAFPFGVQSAVIAQVLDAYYEHRAPWWSWTAQEVYLWA